LLPVCEIAKMVVSNLFGMGIQLTIWTKQGQRIVLCKARSLKGEIALLELGQDIYGKNPEIKVSIPKDFLLELDLLELEEEAFAEIKCENE